MSRVRDDFQEGDHLRYPTQCYSKGEATTEESDQVAFNNVFPSYSIGF
jgi:hypothetical protein